MLRPGEFSGKIKSYYLPETKEGKSPQCAIVFEVFDQNNSLGTIAWYGSFSPKAMKYTLNSLLACGLKEGISSMAGPNAFVIKDVALVLEEHTYEGKTSIRVKYINDPNYISTVVKMDEAKAKAEFMDLDQQIKALRAEKHKADAPDFIDDGTTPF